MSEHHAPDFHELLDAAMPPEVAENRILLCEIGSTSHGCGDGHDDLDTMGIFIEPIEFVVGTRRRAHWVASTGDDQSQNSADDLDVTYYSLRKFAKLALAGNPTITNLFFAPVLESTDAGVQLRENASLFLSRRAAPRYIGYMRAQLERLEGSRGQRDVGIPSLPPGHPSCRPIVSTRDGSGNRHQCGASSTSAMKTGVYGPVACTTASR